MTNALAFNTDKVEAALNNHPWMSYKQAKWMFNLINDRFVFGTPDFEAYRQRWLAVSNLAQFQDLMEHLQDAPKLIDQAPHFVAPTETGLYVNPLSDALYRVVEYRDRLIASRLYEIGGERLTEQGLVVNYEWRLLPDLKQIDAAWKATTDQEVAFGIRYTTCSRCWRRLKDATSVALGIGPECRKKG